MASPYCTLTLRLQIGNDKASNVSRMRDGRLTRVDGCDGSAVGRGVLDSLWRLVSRGLASLPLGDRLCEFRILRRFLRMSHENKIVITVHLHPMVIFPRAFQRSHCALSRETFFLSKRKMMCALMLSLSAPAPSCQSTWTQHQYDMHLKWTACRATGSFHFCHDMPLAAATTTTTTATTV